MKKALSEISPFDAASGEKKPFQVPDGIVTAVIDPVTGFLSTDETEKMVEFFKEGTVPTEYSTKARRELIEDRKLELKIVEMERRKEREKKKQEEKKLKEKTLIR